MWRFYVGLDGHWYLRWNDILIWRSPWRKPEGWQVVEQWKPGMRCPRIMLRMECQECGYPYSEAMYPTNPNVPHNPKSPGTIHYADHTWHFWDCKCEECA